MSATGAFAVWPNLIVLSAPSVAFSCRVVEAHEPVLIQAFGHSAQNLPLKDSIKALSVGLPGREKSRTTPFM